MAKPLTEEEQESWDWLQNFVTDVDAKDVAEWSGVSLRTIQRINDSWEYTPSAKTRAKLLKWAIEEIDSERDGCPW